LGGFSDLFHGGHARKIKSVFPTIHPVMLVEPALTAIMNLPVMIPTAANYPKIAGLDARPRCS
jgi:hypothetical protein